MAHRVCKCVGKPFALKLRVNPCWRVNGDNANFLAVASDATFVTLNDDFLPWVRSQPVAAICPIVDDASLNPVFEPNKHDIPVVALYARLRRISPHDRVNAFPLAKPMVNERKMVNCHVACNPPFVLAIPRVSAQVKPVSVLNLAVIRRANCSVAHVSFNLKEGRNENRILVDHKRRAVAFRNLNEFLRLVKVRQKWLLDENGFALLCCIFNDGHADFKLVRGCDINDADFRMVNQLSPIRRDERQLPSFLHRFCPLLVNICTADDFQASVFVGLNVSVCDAS